MASMEMIIELSDAPIEVKEAEEKIELPPVKGMVEYRNVTFGYDSKILVLKKINLKVDTNQTIAIVGPTGAGKSSMIKLLSRFYDPQEGSIFIDGYNIRDVSFKENYSVMGIVPQDTFLFPTTIKENIRYGKPTATIDEVVEATKRVGVHNFIERLPERYNTEIQEGASNISVGQRQLISFARALLVDPQILILDDATSSVDTETEQRIQEALARLMQDRTCFVIAQRVSTVRNADLILVLDRGKLVAQGRHSDLIRESGIYADIYYRQLRPESWRWGRMSPLSLHPSIRA